MPRKVRDIPWLEIRGGVYYAHWYDRAAGRTKRVSLATADPVEAQVRFAEFLSHGHQIFRDDGAVSLSVLNALDDYMREHVEHHVVAKKRIQQCIANLAPWFKNSAVVDVDIPACRAYADARRKGVLGKPAADATVRRELVTLQAAANHAARWRRIGPAARPPTAMPVIELPREVRGEAVWLTREELDLAIRKATGELKDFILIAYYTGARRASIERLTRFQVDLERGRITLQGADETVNQRLSKKRRPIVPIDPALRPTLERLMAAKPPLDWLLGKPYRDRMYLRFRRLMRRIGMADKARPHILRHSRATHLLQDGVSIYDVARLLGDTVQTVERVYGHHSPEYLAEALNRRRQS